MTDTTLKLVSQTVEIDSVTHVEVTTIQQDVDVGDYVREIRLFGTPAGVDAKLVLTVKIRSPDQAPLQITVPSSGF